MMMGMQEIMSSGRLLMLAAVHVAIVYAFIFYILRSIKQSVNLPLSSFVILVLWCAAVFTCPFLMDAWHKMNLHVKMHHHAMMEQAK